MSLTAEQKEIVRLLNALGNITVSLDSMSVLTDKEQEYNSDLEDEINILYFGNDPDGETEWELKENSEPMTYKDAKNALLTRINNLLNGTNYFQN